MSTAADDEVARQDSARVGLDREGLTLYDVKRADGEILWCSARLQVPGLRAEKEGVAGHYATAFDDLIAYFDALAAAWRGFEGTRVYESMEGDLRLEATHKGSNVALAVTLRQWSGPNGWRAFAEVTLEAGEQLSSAAAEVSALLCS